MGDKQVGEFVEALASEKIEKLMSVLLPYFQAPNSTLRNLPESFLCKKRKMHRPISMLKPED